MADKIEEIFIKSGAVLHGHFLLTSGLHSSVYWEKFKVLQYPQYTGQLCSLIADHFRGQKVDIVAGPTTGGIILAYEVARQLGVRSISGFSAAVYPLNPVSVSWSSMIS
jgi:orotate phosphoribosyltransferase